MAVCEQPHCQKQEGRQNPANCSGGHTEVGCRQGPPAHHRREGTTRLLATPSMRSGRTVCLRDGRDGGPGNGQCKPHGGLGHAPSGCKKCIQHGVADGDATREHVKGSGGLQLACLVLRLVPFTAKGRCLPQAKPASTKETPWGPWVSPSDSTAPSTNARRTKHPCNGPRGI